VKEAKSEHGIRIAIVHDWYVWSGGAERVIEALVGLFPEADLFALVDFYADEERRRFLKGKRVETTFIQKLPFARKHFRNYLPLFPLAIEQLDLKGYDLVISSSHAVAKGVKTHPGQLHISYCYTPMRYAWEMEEEYFRDYRISGIKRAVLRYAFHRFRIWDVASLPRVDRFVAISEHVARRIRRYYGRDSELIYPPVDTERFSFCKEKEDYYLTVSRLVPYKKVDLIVETFVRNGRKLRVVGKGPQLEELRKKAKGSPHVEILGALDDDAVVEMMRHARAFIYAAYEDFGIVPVEAMACGTPVIAYGEGGVRESVREGVDGIFFHRQTVESLQAAIDSFEKRRFDHHEISRRAKEFGRERFMDTIKRLIDKSLNKESKCMKA